MYVTVGVVDALALRFLLKVLAGLGSSGFVSAMIVPGILEDKEIYVQLNGQSGVRIPS